MELIIHRINTLKKLKKIPSKYGVEIDLRSKNSKIILSHDIKNKSEKLTNYLENYNNGTLVLNIKENGIENEVIELVKSYSIKSYFLLDVEMPYIFTSFEKNKNTAIRFSEYESINTAKYFINKLDWIWVDTVTKFPVNKKNIPIISKFKSCFVCPERWGRKKDIIKYKKLMRKINFYPTSIMTNKSCVKLWEN
tara:strand:- start:1053 stop:1634 length:582 start_codon:yes stop_codon:yes gene_type:complete